MKNLRRPLPNPYGTLELTSATQSKQCLREVGEGDQTYPGGCPVCTVKAGFPPQPLCAPPSPRDLSPSVPWCPPVSHRAVTLAVFPPPSFCRSICLLSATAPSDSTLPLCKFPPCPGEIPTASGPCGSLGASLGWSRDRQEGMRQPVGFCPSCLSQSQGQVLVLPAVAHPL